MRDVVINVSHRSPVPKRCAYSGIQILHHNRPLEKHANRYPLRWRYGPDLYQCMLGVIVAASSGALSATKFFGNKKS
jgi:hypothetical protein